MAAWNPYYATSPKFRFLFNQLLSDPCRTIMGHVPDRAEEMKQNGLTGGNYNSIRLFIQYLSARAYSDRRLVGSNTLLR